MSHGSSGPPCRLQKRAGRFYCKTTSCSGACCFPCSIPYFLHSHRRSYNGRSGKVKPDMHEIQQGTFTACIGHRTSAWSTGDFLLAQRCGVSSFCMALLVPREHIDLQAAGRSVRQDLLVWDQGRNARCLSFSTLLHTLLHPFAPLPSTFNYIGAG